ncbi:MAG TPA: FkbM family methyltransferase, partial [Cytophagaceae bacterium]|nr:FkbM family methyltransferase [Cytophagaceae bacterium]
FRKYKKYTVVDYPDTKDLVKIALRVKSSDFLVLKQIFINQEYFSIVTILNKYNIKPSVIIDCGANIGLTSLYLKNQYPLTTIICIEPDRSNVSSIRENILLNNYKGLSVLEKGIWKENKILYLHSDFRDGRDWAYTLNENISPIKIETVTIANLISLFNIREIDFLKIDIEGSEKELFLDKEIENWLSITNVIAIEIHDEFNCRADILSILAQFDFEISYSGELVIGVNKKLRYKQ